MSELTKQEQEEWLNQPPTEQIWVGKLIDFDGEPVAFWNEDRPRGEMYNYTRTEKYSSLAAVAAEIAKEIESVANQLALSAMNRAGDYSKENQEDMKLEAMWSGQLQRALQSYREFIGNE
jgi:hypothetical protein